MKLCWKIIRFTEKNLDFIEKIAVVLVGRYLVGLSLVLTNHAESF